VVPSVRVVLATNATSRLASDLQKLELPGLFYSLANSSEIGNAKPAPEFFQAALRLAGVDAENALFIDDTRENVVAANALVISAHHFTDTSRMEQFLREHRVLREDEL
jgi:putative hydrolase of the HAD superfamily